MLGKCAKSTNSEVRSESHDRQTTISNYSLEFASARIAFVQNVSWVMRNYFKNTFATPKFTMLSIFNVASNFIECLFQSFLPLNHLSFPKFVHFPFVWPPVSMFICISNRVPYFFPGKCAKQESRIMLVQFQKPRYFLRFFTNFMNLYWLLQ